MIVGLLEVWSSTITPILISKAPCISVRRSGRCHFLHAASRKHSGQTNGTQEYLQSQDNAKRLVEGRNCSGLSIHKRLFPPDLTSFLSSTFHITAELADFLCLGQSRQDFCTSHSSFAQHNILHHESLSQQHHRSRRGQDVGHGCCVPTHPR